MNFENEWLNRNHYHIKSKHLPDILAMCVVWNNANSHWLTEYSQHGQKVFKRPADRTKIENALINKVDCAIDNAVEMIQAKDGRLYTGFL